VDAERDGWILIAARWPDRIREFIGYKLVQLEDPLVVRLYRVLSALLDSEVVDETRLVEAADIMAALAEKADAAGELNPAEVDEDELPFDLLDGLALEADPRATRLIELMRERGWSGWNRVERVEPG
jgi:hypothetical protein